MFPGNVAEALATYVDLIRRWAPRVDLVAPGDLPRLEERHVADSLRLLPLLDEIGGPAADVGSGAGFPGIPLATARPEVAWTVLEPRRKRASFLEEVVRTLELSNVRVRPVSAQEAASDPRLSGSFRFACARAVAPPAEVFDLLRPLLTPLGTAATFVGDSAMLPRGVRWWTPGIAVLSQEMDDFTT